MGEVGHVWVRAGHTWVRMGHVWVRKGQSRVGEDRPCVGEDGPCVGEGRSRVGEVDSCVGEDRSCVGEVGHVWVRAGHMWVRAGCVQGRRATCGRGWATWVRTDPPQLHPQRGAAVSPGHCGADTRGAGTDGLWWAGSVGKDEALASSPHRSSWWALGRGPVILECHTSGLPHQPPSAPCPCGGGLWPLGVATFMSWWHASPLLPRVLVVLACGLLGWPHS